tara:strand:+ start:564 stop:1595 length:1032 start_codon:yes stop_codon:yes gene_type:complete
MSELINYPFFDLDNLKYSFFEDKLSIGSKFERIIVIGVGGSSQGSKAINGFLNEDRVIYFDHLNYNLINKTLEKDLERTGFIFVSKSGTTSETLTIFDYLISQLENKIDITNHFFSITEYKSSPLYDLSVHNSIKVIEHKKEIVGRFSIFSNVSLIPGFYFHEELIDHFFEGARKGFALEKNAKEEADKDYNLLNKGKMINASLIYGDELKELANWKKQLFAESLGKQGKGLMPIIARMTNDQHSLLQLFMDGPKNIFYEIMSLNYSHPNLLNITLNNHKDAMNDALNKEIGEVRERIFNENNLADLGQYFSYEIIRVIYLSQLLKVDPFTQDAVEIQKNLLK